MFICGIPSDWCGWKYLVRQPFVPMQWQICSHQGIIFRTFFFCFNRVSNCVLIVATTIKFQLPDCIYGVTSTVEFGACMSWLLCLDTEKGSPAGFSHELICCWRLGNHLWHFFIHVLFYWTSFVPATIQIDQLPHFIITLSIQFFVAAISMHKSYHLDVIFL